MAILTSAAIVCSSFLLGILFTTFLWDYTLLFAKEKVTAEVIGAFESYYLTWWNGAAAVKIFLHVVIAILFMSLTAKFASRSEAGFYFSGASLLLLMLMSSTYVAITIPSIKAIARDPLIGTSSDEQDVLSRFQHWITKYNTGPLGQSFRDKRAAELAAAPMDLTARISHDSVLSAANVIAILLMIGIVVLQIGEWYVEATVVQNEKESVLIEEVNLQQSGVKSKSPHIKVGEEKKKQ